MASSNPFTIGQGMRTYYYVSWADPAYPEIRVSSRRQDDGAGARTGDELTLAQAKAEIDGHAAALIQHWQDVRRRNRELRSTDFDVPDYALRDGGA